LVVSILQRKEAPQALGDPNVPGDPSDRREGDQVTAAELRLSRKIRALRAELRDLEERQRANRGWKQSHGERVEADEEDEE
jgi:hypothetical protein